MLRNDPQTLGDPSAIRPPLASFAGVAFVLSVPLALTSAATMQSALVALGSFVIAAALLARSFKRDYPHRRLGLCNVVTLVRVALVAFLFGSLFDPYISDWFIFCVATLAFTLDGFDGWLARRADLASGFGARFDMETDAALAAVLSLSLLTSGITGPEILILGFTRYAFVLAAQFIPALKRDLPVSFRRKAICVVQIAALIVLIFPLTPAALVQPISVAAAALLLWSFATDIWWLLQQSGVEASHEVQSLSPLGDLFSRPFVRNAARLTLA
ncbi:MAG: CDP-alcohol phosphatidyltransferase family protein, partial [Pseudomonadota bacterium]